VAASIAVADPSVTSSSSYRISSDQSAGALLVSVPALSAKGEPQEEQKLPDASAPQCEQNME